MFVCIFFYLCILSFFVDSCIIFVPFFPFTFGCFWICCCWFFFLCALPHINSIVSFLWVCVWLCLSGIAHTFRHIHSSSFVWVFGGFDFQAGDKILRACYNIHLISCLHFLAITISLIFLAAVTTTAVSECIHSFVLLLLSLSISLFVLRVCRFFSVVCVAATSMI